MIVLIETDLGKISLDVSFAGYMGAKQLNWGGSTFDVKESSITGLPFVIANNRGEIILPIGSVEFVKKASELLDIKLPDPLNIPTALVKSTNRKTWSCKKSDLSYPVFIKPLHDVKLFTGFVARSEKDFELYPEIRDWDGMLWCSDVMDEIISEWRCYVIKGKVFNCSCYAGDALAFPDRNEINKLVTEYVDAPNGYSLDVAVTKSGTNLIECNDAWSLGYYGGEFVDYFKMVKERWLEINNYE